eukprot:COSAG03_NODE_3448_length_2004_cov_17.315739_4_plen_108_part_00
MNEAAAVKTARVLTSVDVQPAYSRDGRSVTYRAVAVNNPMDISTIDRARLRLACQHHQLPECPSHSPQARDLNALVVCVRSRDAAEFREERVLAQLFRNRSGVIEPS